MARPLTWLDRLRIERITGRSTSVSTICRAPHVSPTVESFVRTS